MSKYLWDLTLQDFKEHSVWQLAYWKDDSLEETVVCPASKSDALNLNSELLVKAKFKDALGVEFVGYVKYGATGIEASQPCMFIGNTHITFWFGISTPNISNLVKLNFPIIVTSEATYGLKEQTETIKGYGYISSSSNNVVMYS
ncbi:hypothetical protein ACFOD0_02670 [Shewanella intestini]|uniref:Uncharacterized protein n=1 Tax=Shewanella intestini TaxID=2017544 RepID=A0ABS5I8K2_9GAMM|nr:MULTISPECIES: hypothetical protein [Shewanella]MBR9729655.1 hypothetical protein [Shewanella intestini]MRG36266.1 hypothetical protein [Shewanella sp. XMDDZSB0408]